MLQLSSQNMEEMRRLRHDIKNHCAYMELLLREGRYEELNEYFGQMQDYMQQPLSQIDCGNETISAILNLEYAKAASRGASMECSVTVPPELPFDKLRMCSLLTNLIDNAIEACEKLENTDAKVEIAICQRRSWLYISVENPVQDAAGTTDSPSLHTTKQDKALHGYGSKIVDDIVRKYNGQINRTVEHGEFIADVMLDMCWQDTQLTD
ncbi:MAG: ATP-binding protein [Clostridiales bacterium]|nr:ATP-binding protein [Clostridiales bacterium]